MSKSNKSHDISQYIRPIYILILFAFLFTITELKSNAVKVHFFSATYSDKDSTYVLLWQNYPPSRSREVAVDVTFSDFSEAFDTKIIYSTMCKQIVRHVRLKGSL